jgi:hypothetical protein
VTIDEEQDAIRAYLAPIDVRRQHHSCLDAALRDARGASLRDPTSGKPVDEVNHSRNWLGAVGYMIIIDQLGSALRPDSETDVTPVRRRASSFERCLRRFTHSSPQTISALYGLRCALAHDYGLINPPPDGADPSPQHRLFLLNPDEPALVTSPIRAWDGKLDPTPGPDRATSVNPRQFANEVEDLVASLRESPPGALRIALQGGVRELRLRFFFSARLGG